MPVVALQFCDSATTLAKGKMQFFLRKKSEKKSDTRAGVGGKNITQPDKIWLVDTNLRLGSSTLFHDVRDTIQICIEFHKTTVQVLERIVKYVHTQQLDF